MPGDFKQVVDKFGWAIHQLATLDKAVSDYIDLKPYVSVVKDKPDAEGYQVVAHLRHPPPTAIAHIVGDVLNSLQGTLDYLAWQLALREGTAPDLRSAFPIVKVPHKSAAHPDVNIFRSKDVGRGRVPLISDPVVLALLRDVQPYHLPESDRHLSPLLLLRTLNGESKHRHPAVVTTAIDQGHYAYMLDRTTGHLAGIIPDGETAAVLTMNVAPLKDGDEMAWVPYALAPEEGLPEQTDFATFVALEEAPVYPRTGQPFPVVQAFTDIAMFIDNNILMPFSPLFGVTPPAHGVGPVW